MYSIETYDFKNDEIFQAFFTKKRQGKYLPFNEYMKILKRCKKEYIKHLNSPHSARRLI